MWAARPTVVTNWTVDVGFDLAVVDFVVDDVQHCHYYYCWIYVVPIWHRHPPVEEVRGIEIDSVVVDYCDCDDDDDDDCRIPIDCTTIHHYCCC